MKKATKLLAILLVVCMVLPVLASCGKNKKGAGVYTYNTYTAQSPSNWNELTYQDNNDTQIMGYIGSSFFTYDYKFDAQGNIVPGDFVMKYSAATKLEDVTAEYAEEWGLPAAGKGYAWKITLRNDLQWQNGDAIKAEDFVYTMKEQLNPDFQNYRADSFYVGATIIQGAKDYAKQGQSGLFAADVAYSVYSEDIDSTLIFKLGAKSDASPAISYMRSWLESQQLDTDQFTAAQAAGVLASNFFAESEVVTAESLAALEGKTFAEIKADAGMKAVWDEVIGWWQTEPNEELHFFVANYTYPEASWDDVGFFAPSDYEIVLVLEKSLPLLKEDGSLSYQAAYNMASLPLVHKATYEKCKIPPAEGSTLWTSNYNSSKETTMSWGPYKLTSFQSGTQYVVERNDKWYGYGLEENKGLYQTDKVVCDTIKEFNSAFAAFLSGNIDGIGIDVTIADEYKNSDRAYFTPDDFVNSLQLQSDTASLKAREDEANAKGQNIDKEILADINFRKALSLAIDRADFSAKTTTSSLAGFGLFNSMHYYDVENGKAYRESDDAKRVLCSIYDVNPDDFGGDLDKAVDSITGYDINAARALVTEAYNAAVAAGTIDADDKVFLTMGSGAINETVQKRFDFIGNAWKELMVGTPLEGRFEYEVQDFATAWAKDFRAGKYDVCMGGWSGAAWDPGYFLLAYLSPDYMYSTAWDTSSVMMEFTMKGVGENGEDITETMSLMQWYDCLNGATDAKYDWSATALPQEKRLQLIAALEEQVLKVYYSVPLSNSFSASMLSYKVDYITYEYNTFMGYGGIKYMTYNYDDAQWAEFVKDNGGELNYK